MNAITDFLGTRYADVLRASLLELGNYAPVQRVLQRLASGETARIGFLGGSLTAPAVTRGRSGISYVDLLHTLLLPRFPAAICENYGINGTSSAISYHAALRTVLRNLPELVFLEFAVNGFTTPENLRCYEAMISDFRRAGTAVISVFVTNEGLVSGQPSLAEISARYALPMVSPGDAVRYAVQQLQLPWSCYAEDRIHANDNGQQLIADCIFTLLLQIFDAPALTASPPCPTAPYCNAMLLDAGALANPNTGFVPTQSGSLFPAGLAHLPGDARPLCFQLSCRQLFVLHQLHPEACYGAAVVQIDDREPIILEGCSVTSWGNPAAACLLYDTTTAMHRITLNMLGCDTDKQFVLLGFGYQT